MWVPPENKDPILLHAPTRKSIACFGAVNLRTGKFVRRMCTVFNAQTFEGFLRLLLRHQMRRRRMILVLDNARYHHAVLLGPFLRQHAPRLSLFVSAALQSPARPNRAGVEVDPAPGHSQPLLPYPRRGARGGRMRYYKDYAALFNSPCLIYVRHIAAVGALDKALEVRLVAGRQVVQRA
jgi:hypothetical protein